MDKQTYLKSIKTLFKRNGVTDQSSNNVVSEYETLYDEAMDSGFTHEQIINRLGTAPVIFNSLKNDLIFNSAENHKLVAISPFIAVIIFMILGFGFNLWHPGWLIFFIIPLTAILSNFNKENLASSSIFIVTAAYILTAHFYPDFYSFGISIFAIPILLFILIDTFDWKNLVLSILVILAIIAQQIYGHASGNWSFTWLVYAIPLCFGILVGKVKVTVTTSKLDKTMLILSLVFVIIYLVLLLLYPNQSYWTWLILLLIPMLFIYGSEKFKEPVAYTPFITTIIYFALGFVFNLWSIAWLVFLLIPITAILTDKHK